MEIRITREQILAASTYMTLAEKTELLNRADRCFDRLSITSGGEAMPPMWKENYGIKARYLMAALARMLKLPYEADNGDEMLMNEKDYDRFGDSHVIMQIERFKRDKDEAVRDAAYDLMGDYFQLEKAFSAEIKAMLDVQNDAVIRQQQMSKEAMAELPKVMEALKELQRSRDTNDSEIFAKRIEEWQKENKLKEG